MSLEVYETTSSSPRESSRRAPRDHWGYRNVTSPFRCRHENCSRAPALQSRPRDASEASPSEKKVPSLLRKERVQHERSFHSCSAACRACSFYKLWPLSSHVSYADAHVILPPSGATPASKDAESIATRSSDYSTRTASSSSSSSKHKPRSRAEVCTVELIDRSPTMTRVDLTPQRGSRDPLSMRSDTETLQKVAAGVLKLATKLPQNSRFRGVIFGHVFYYLGYDEFERFFEVGGASTDEIPSRQSLNYWQAVVLSIEDDCDLENESELMYGKSREGFLRAASALFSGRMEGDSRIGSGNRDRCAVAEFFSER